MGPGPRQHTFEHHGWALTVNTADRADVYRLVTDGDTYRYGDTWVPFDEKRAWLPVDTPWLTLWIPKTFRRSVHGPVLETDDGTFAVRHVGQEEQGVRAGEQWFRMNKAVDLESFRAAMAMVAIPMFNVVYADAEHVWFVYNARIPVSTLDRAAELPGDDPAALWTEVLPLEQLPQVLDPASGFVQASNSTPGTRPTGPRTPFRAHSRRPRASRHASRPDPSGPSSSWPTARRSITTGSSG